MWFENFEKMKKGQWAQERDQSNLTPSKSQTFL
jgi:hypothetical protein